MTPNRRTKQTKASRAEWNVYKMNLKENENRITLFFCLLRRVAEKKSAAHGTRWTSNATQRTCVIVMSLKSHFTFTNHQLIKPLVTSTVIKFEFNLHFTDASLVGWKFSAQLKDICCVCVFFLLLSIILSPTAMPTSLCHFLILATIHNIQRSPGMQFDPQWHIPSNRRTSHSAAILSHKTRTIAWSIEVGGCLILFFFSFPSRDHVVFYQHSTLFSLFTSANINNSLARHNIRNTLTVNE